MYRSVGTNNLKRHPLTFSIILTLIAGMVLCAVPVQGISAQTSFFMQSGQPLYSARTSDYRSGYAAQYSAVLKALAGGAKPEFGSVGGEWKVLALARSGFYPTQSGYFPNTMPKSKSLSPQTVRRNCTLKNPPKTRALLSLFLQSDGMHALSQGLILPRRSVISAM